MESEILKICRTCLCEANELTSTLNQVDCTSGPVELQEVLLHCSLITISYHSKLPKHICNKCKTQAINFFNFKELCHKSEQKLLQFTSQSYYNDQQINIGEFLQPKVEIKNETDDIDNANDSANCSLPDDNNSDCDFNADDDVSIKTNNEVKCSEENLNTTTDPDSKQNILMLKLNESNDLSMKLVRLRAKNGKQLRRESKENIKVLKIKYNGEVIRDKNQHKQRSKQCHECNKLFKTSSDLNRHIKRHCKETSFHCFICKRSFPDQSELDIHSETHEGETNACEDCGKQFTERVDLAQHLEFEHPEHKQKTNTHQCEVCGKVFNHKSVLKIHLERHKEEIVTCNECGKQFQNSIKLKAHLQVHIPEKPHLCTVCGRAFACSSNLKTHMRIHNGEKPYVCNVCGKAFAQWSSLRSHQPVHSDEKHFTCPTCGKAFSRKNVLRLHMRYHTGIRNYPCTMCDKRFYDAQMLKKHSVVHTGEKNYKCEFCGKAFNRKSNLDVHRKIHTGDRPHVCSVCGRGFIQLHVLNSHMNTHK